MTNTRNVRLEEPEDKPPTTTLILSIPANVDVAAMVREYNANAEANGLPLILSAEKRDVQTP